MTIEKISSRPSFSELKIIEPLLRALDDVGYESPSPIQAKIIPHVLAGVDVLGQAQTGTGKTAAFALPLLSKIILNKQAPQVLVLVPTRELALQVAEAFKRYAQFLPDFHVLPIYGGQDYRSQIRQLKHGVHVVVGTPGRVMDHMRRGTLQLQTLTTVVLDEADEMLHMGFIDDIEWILEKTPAKRQIALFSATMPAAIHRVARKYLRQPKEITIKERTTVADTIAQRVWIVNGFNKLDALTRILEVADFDGMIVFVRTKTATIELAEKLEARGYRCASLNGDIPQHLRERTVEQFKAGNLDILVATDVAARGLDVDRVSHVVNYDIPYDTEAYIHRIGRTGRAGRKGEAILFVAPRERRLLRAIEKATKQKLELMTLPTTESINDQRIARFKQRITDILATEDWRFYLPLLEQYQKEHEVSALDIAAALARLQQGDDPLLLQPKLQNKKSISERPVITVAKKRLQRGEALLTRGRSLSPQKGMARFRIEVGHIHGVTPGNIVGAIANEAGLSSKCIGRIYIDKAFSIVELPIDLPREIFQHLRKVWVSGQQLKIARIDTVTAKSQTEKVFTHKRVS